jgi:hypothetical protein
VLWPKLKGAERAWLGAEYTLDGVRWSASVDGGRAEHQRDGVPADPPAFPSDAERDRYSLALHELLQSEDAHFAEKILRESAGGYDVTEAGAVLRPRTAATRSGAEVRALEDAERGRRAAREAQERIRAEEASLARLEAERAAAEQAVLRAGVLEAACEHAGARDAERDARIALEPFPGWMPKLRGDETERLARIRERRAELSRALEQAEEAFRAAGVAIEETGLPEGGLPGGAIPALRADLEMLREAERGVRSLEQEQAGLQSTMEEERQRVSGALGERELQDLEHPQLGELADFAREAAEVHQTQRELELSLQIIGDASVPQRAELLGDGIRLLQSWLRESGPAVGSDRPRRLGLIAAGLLVALGLGFTFINLLALLAVIAGAVLLVLLLGREAGPDDARPVHQREYLVLRLDAPAAWTPAEVERTLRDLQTRHADAVLAKERQRRGEELAARLREHQPKVERVEAEREAIARSLGVEPVVAEGQLYWLATRVCAWQNARNALVASHARITAASTEVERLREALQARLATHSGGELATSGDLAGAIEELDRRQRTLAEARSARKRAEADGERLRGELSECAAEARGIFEALGLTPDDEDTLVEWSTRHDEYRALREDQQRRATLLAQARKRLESRGGAEALRSTPLPELELELARARAETVGLDEIRERIFAIRHDVAAAKRSHDVEAALEREERCRAALRATRDADIRAVIGHVLIEHVQEETRDQHLPAVFHAASDLFNRLTHGRYELRFGTDDGPRFLAYDNREGRGRTLEQLSSGTRVQLLLAVRIAFVESQEQGVKLPLVLDEVLGNSDDERAGAIIEAAIELARAGRQIFYFTAQHDEIGKWRAMLERHDDVPFRAIDLREVRRGAGAAELVTGAAAFQPRPPVPHPNGDDHLSYGERLRVPRLERGAAHAGELHLWYLTGSPEELHRLLSIGPERWGEMEPFLARGGDGLLGDGQARRLAVRARAAEICIQEGRVGVGKRVDRAVIESSGAITASFFDRVVELAADLDGDAVALIDALRDRVIPRFRDGYTDALEAHLEEHGYLDRRPPLHPAEIRARVVAALAHEIRAAEITVGEVEELLQRVFAGMGVQKEDGDAALPAVGAADAEVRGKGEAVDSGVERSGRVDDGAVPESELELGI